MGRQMTAREGIARRNKYVEAGEEAEKHEDEYGLEWICEVKSNQSEEQMEEVFRVA